MPEGFVVVGGEGDGKARDRGARYGEARNGKARKGGWLRADLAAHASALWGGGAPLEGAAGRGGVFAVRLGDAEAVVRPLVHGGALAGLFGGRYASPRRVRDELRVHAALHARGLPVVPPIGAVWRRRGIWGWELRFATARVDAVPLTAAVRARPEARGALLAAAGSVVGAALGMGLEHPDLHPDNLLARFEGGRPRLYLLDFDRARLRSGPVPQEIADRTLLRFARYPFRHRERVGDYGLRDAARFLQGMGETRARRRATLQRLGPALQQALARRGLA